MNKLKKVTIGLLTAVMLFISLNIGNGHFIQFGQEANAAPTNNFSFGWSNDYASYIYQNSSGDSSGYGGHSYSISSNGNGFIGINGTSVSGSINSNSTSSWTGLNVIYYINIYKNDNCIGEYYSGLLYPYFNNGMMPNCSFNFELSQEYSKSDALTYKIGQMFWINDKPGWYSSETHVIANNVYNTNSIPSISATSPSQNGTLPIFFNREMEDA